MNGLIREVRLHRATRYLGAGGDVFSLQKILGRSTLEMTHRCVELASPHVVIQHRRFSPFDRLKMPPLAMRKGQP